MNVSLIGSNSFLAEYLIRELVENGISPKLFGRRKSEEFPSLNFQSFNFPQNDIDIFELLKSDVIIYTAGAGVQANLVVTPEMMYEINCFVPIRLTNALSANNYKGKLITFGSYFEIGNETDKKYYSENDLLASLNEVPNHYCSSKRVFSRYLASSPSTPKFYHLMLPNIYGKGENANRLIPYLINSLNNDEPISLTSGDQIRQYIHVIDISKTVLDIIKESYPKGFYNLCRKEEVQIKDLVKKVFVLCGQTEKFENSNLFGSKERSDTRMRCLLLENGKAMHTFKFQPQISIEEGLKSYLI